MAYKTPSQANGIDSSEGALCCEFFDDLMRPCLTVASDYLERLRARLLAQPTYLANEHALVGGHWRAVDGGATWARDDGDRRLRPILLSIVGLADDKGFELAPLGTYDYSLNNLDSAEWVFTLRMPCSSVFEDDYKRALFRMNVLQGVRASSSECGGVLSSKDGMVRVALAAPLFVKKVSGSSAEVSLVRLRGLWTDCAP